MYVGHLHHDSSLDRRTFVGMPDGLEKDMLVSILNIYNSESIEYNIINTMNMLNSMIDNIQNGYNPIVGTNPKRTKKAKSLKMWRQRIQSKIEELASPRVGKDRQAIALACYRDFIFKKTNDDKIAELVECRRQLNDLLTSISRASFEF